MIRERTWVVGLLLGAALLSACGGGSAPADRQEDAPGQAEADSEDDSSEDEAPPATSSCEDEKHDVVLVFIGGSPEENKPPQRSEDLLSVDLEATPDSLSIDFETATASKPAKLRSEVALGGEGRDMWSVTIYEESELEPYFQVQVADPPFEQQSPARLWTDFTREEGAPEFGNFATARPIEAEELDIGEGRVQVSVATEQLPELSGAVSWYAEAITQTGEAPSGDSCPDDIGSMILTRKQADALPTLKVAQE